MAVPLQGSASRACQFYGTLRVIVHHLSTVKSIALLTNKCAASVAEKKSSAIVRRNSESSRCSLVTWQGVCFGDIAVLPVAALFDVFPKGSTIFLVVIAQECCFLSNDTRAEGRLLTRFRCIIFFYSKESVRKFESGKRRN